MRLKHIFLDIAIFLSSKKHIAVAVMGFSISKIKKLYERIGQVWNNDNGAVLEALGGGFNITLEALQDKEKRKF